MRFQVQHNFLYTAYREGLHGWRYIWAGAPHRAATLRHGAGMIGIRGQLKTDMPSLCPLLVISRNYNSVLCAHGKGSMLHANPLFPSMRRARKKRQGGESEPG